MENNLTKLFEDTDKIDEHSNNICMNCGATLGNDFTTKCPVCGYDSEELFTCPYQVQAEVQGHSLLFCQLSKKQCKVDGLNFEICPVFRSLDSIKTE